MQRRILVTGAAGQIGSELTMALRREYGEANVIAVCNKTPLPINIQESGPWTQIDCMNGNLLARVIENCRINTIFHLAALLSATAEANPMLGWNLNMSTLFNVLEAARENNCAVFTPSSIGAFGHSTPQDDTPQDTIQRPSTMYGITKVAGELLCDYYFKRYGVDTRGLRYPGIISNVTLPGGGTTDYAVHIFYEAIKCRSYTCFLKAGTYLDMMYMPDAIKAAINLMEADPDRLKHRNAFNVSAMSFEPEMIAAEIKKWISDFVMDYNIDPIRQTIAESWPNKMDDSAAREEWGWSPEYDLTRMVKDMIEVLLVKLFCPRNL